MNIAITVIFICFLMRTDQSRVHPKMQSKQIGSTATFKCSSYILWMVTWTFNGGALPRNADMYGSRPGILTIKNVSMSNEGVYECKGILKPEHDGDHAVFVAAGILNVTG